MQVVDTLTGEVMEFADTTPEEIKDSWLQISKQIQALERAKDKLKPKVAELLDEFGKCEIGDYMFRQTTVQRRNYDKGILKEVIKDEGLLDEMLQPNKKFIDDWLKENVETSGEIGTLIRDNMIDVGEPFSQTRLEQIK